MAHPLDIPVALGSSQTGLELQAQQHGGTVLASTYDEEGGGAYTLHLSAVPDGFRGAVRVYGRAAGSADAWVFKASTALNPEESENADVRTSTRATPADVPAAPDLSNLDAAVSSRVATADVRLAHLDADVSSRLAAAGYTAPDNADVAAALAQLVDASHGLAAILAAVETRTAPGDLANLDAPVSSRAAAADYTAARAALLDRLDAAVSSRLAAAAYQAPLDALATAVAVWDALTADHVAAGSMGAALGAVAVAQDPLTNPVPSAYAPGTAGAALGRLIGGPLAVVSMVDRQAALTLVAGDDYLFADGRQIDIVRASGDAWPADLTGWVLSFTARDLRGGLAEVTAQSVSSPNPSGAAQAVRVELAASVTSKLAAPAGVTPTWVYGVEAANGGRRVTLRSGQLRLTAAP